LRKEECGNMLSRKKQPLRVSRKKAVLLDKKKRRNICKKAFYEIFYELFEAVKSEYFNIVALSNVLKICMNRYSIA